MRHRFPLLVAGILLVAGCHRAQSAPFGPNPQRTAAECSAVIEGVRADTNPATSPRATAIEIVLPVPGPSPQARGLTATLWVPVDERGRVRANTVRVSGMPDHAFARRLREAAAAAKWKPPTRDGCWVPGWGYLTYNFPK